jgi:hypothetical protein
MGDLLGSLVWGAKSGQYCVIGSGLLHWPNIILQLKFSMEEYEGNFIVRMTKKYYLPPFLFSFKMIRNFSKQNHFMHLLPKDKFHNCIERFLHRLVSRVVNKPSLSE